MCSKDTLVTLLNCYCHLKQNLKASTQEIAVLKDLHKTVFNHFVNFYQIQVQVWLIICQLWKVQKPRNQLAGLELKQQIMGGEILKEKSFI